MYARNGNFPMELCRNAVHVYTAIVQMCPRQQVRQTNSQNCNCTHSRSSWFRVVSKILECVRLTIWLIVILRTIICSNLIEYSRHGNTILTTIRVFSFFPSIHYEYEVTSFATFYVYLIFRCAYPLDDYKKLTPVNCST